MSQGPNCSIHSRSWKSILSVVLWAHEGQNWSFCFLTFRYLLKCFHLKQGFWYISIKRVVKFKWQEYHVKYVEVFKMKFLKNIFLGWGEGVGRIGVHYKRVYIWFECDLSGSHITRIHRWGGPDRRTFHTWQVTRIGQPQYSPGIPCLCNLVVYTLCQCAVVSMSPRNSVFEESPCSDFFPFTCILLRYVK